MTAIVYGGARRRAIDPNPQTVVPLNKLLLCAVSVSGPFDFSGQLNRAILERPNKMEVATKKMIPKKISRLFVVLVDSGDVGYNRRDAPNMSPGVSLC
jgi:hypothetical protein